VEFEPGEGGRGESSEETIFVGRIHGSLHPKSSF
jgi:hypothetical protein